MFTKKGTAPEINRILSEAFSYAGLQDSYKSVLANFNINFLGYTGAEAANYISSWRENTVNALKKSGALD